MWNLDNKINKQNRNRLIDAENRLIVERGEKGGRLAERGREIKKYKLIVTE